MDTVISNKKYRVENYSDDLINNLAIKPVENPSYICNQFSIKQCKNLTEEKFRKQCESVWSKICPEEQQQQLQSQNTAGGTGGAGQQ